MRPPAPWKSVLNRPLTPRKSAPHPARQALADPIVYPISVAALAFTPPLTPCISSARSARQARPDPKFTPSPWWRWRSHHRLFPEILPRAQHGKPVPIPNSLPNPWWRRRSHHHSHPAFLPRVQPGKPSNPKFSPSPWWRRSHGTPPTPPRKSAPHPARQARPDPKFTPSPWCKWRSHQPRHQEIFPRGQPGKPVPIPNFLPLHGRGGVHTTADSQKFSTEPSPASPPRSQISSAILVGAGVHTTTATQKFFRDFSPASQSGSQGTPIFMVVTVPTPPPTPRKSSRRLARSAY